jgi:hypothetical protein
MTAQPAASRRASGVIVARRAPGLEKRALPTIFP